MKKKVLIFSGFLGSGKTTTMVNTAKYLKEKGIKVGIITNDLGRNLVDTNYVDKESLPVSEIPDGCFCHDVETFADRINKLYDEEGPDIIFAEPVGSCVDIVKNVYYEIAANYDDFELAPFTSVIDPERYKAIYMNEGDNAFQPQITYMYKKQLEEADILLLNKIDTLTENDIQDIISSIRSNFPDKIIIPISALESINLNIWTGEFLDGQTSGMTDLDIDWDYVYQAENIMGWYNKHFILEYDDFMDFNKFSEDLLTALKSEFMKNDIEVVHMKLMLANGDEYCKSALTGTSHRIFTAHKFIHEQKKTDVIINIRAQATPDLIETMVEKTLKKSISDADLNIKKQETQAFDSFAHAPEPTVVI